MIELITIILSIVVGIVQWYNEPRKVKQRNDHARDKEIVNGNSKKLSVRLSDAFDRMRRKDSNSKG